MPRVSRFVVHFDIAGRTWEAAFSHKHARAVCPHLRPDGTQLCVVQQCSHYDDKGRPLHTVKDCPQVRLKDQCPTPVVDGFDYRIESGPDAGRHIKVQHLTTVQLRHKGAPTFLPGAAPCTIKDVYNWRAGLHLALQRALEKARYCKLIKVNGKITVTDKQPLYDEVCEAFWREMRVRAPEAIMAPAVRHNVPHGLGAVEQVYGCTPPHNMHGTAWAGCD